MTRLQKIAQLGNELTAHWSCLPLAIVSVMLAIVIMVIG